LTHLRPIQCALLFSSISSIIGSKGNASYAAANAAMDNMAKASSASGLNVRSIQWGAWASIGMAARQLKLSKETSLELGMLSVLEGINAVDRALRGIHCTVMLVSPPAYWINAAKFIKSAENLIQDFSLHSRSKQRKYVSVQRDGPVITSIEIIEAIKDVLNIHSLDLEMPLGQQGLESLSSLELKSKLDTMMAPQTMALEDLMAESPNGLLQMLLAEIPRTEEEKKLRQSKAARIKMRLFCLPWAGGVSENLFAHWDGIFPSCVEIYPVQIPGRGRLANEDPLQHISTLSDHLIQTLPLDELPYAIFGTCLGAIIGYDIIQKLECSERRKPLLFFPAAVSPPDKYASVVANIYSPPRSIFSFPRRSTAIRDEVLRRLENWRSLPKDDILYAFEAGHFAGIEEMKESDLLFDRVAPIAIHDIVMAVNYEFRTSTSPISMPIVAFDGIKDNTIPREYMKGWRKHTINSFKRVLVDSNHYFVASHYLEIASKCSQECLAALDSTDPILPRKHSWVSDEPSISRTDQVATQNNPKFRSKIMRIFAAVIGQLLFMHFLVALWQRVVKT